MGFYFENKRILVTGACGTVSRELIRQLLASHKIGELIGIDNFGEKSTYASYTFRRQADLK